MESDTLFYNLDIDHKVKATFTTMICYNKYMY